ncbi:MAG: Transposase [uncultured Chloroflexia bacterium]|uniref:Transposase n=1 Tax=uncultured Chloroflexia bacterium TaxID=1672391 RepID=A0A6J4JDC2_9CHLR|nr:MAG: Transposase [uncultured Chloroflexia bacterium]
MANHPRYQRSLDELFLHVYVYIDDWLEPYQKHLPRHCKQKASISELLTIAVVGELLAQPFESTWYWLVRQRFSDLFPRLPEYSRYHRVLRNAEPLLAALALSVVGQSRLHVIDSKPLPIAKGKRAEWAKLPEAAKGFSTSTSMKY